jgi:hypothetical protein
MSHLYDFTRWFGSGDRLRVQVDIAPVVYGDPLSRVSFIF